MARIFLALTPDKDLNDQIIELKKDLKNNVLSEADISWQKNSDHHLTLNFVGSMAVSYTHLTLPTIYSV